MRWRALACAAVSRDAVSLRMRRGGNRRSAFVPGDTWFPSTATEALSGPVRCFTHYIRGQSDVTGLLISSADKGIENKYRKISECEDKKGGKII